MEGGVSGHRPLARGMGVNDEIRRIGGRNSHPDLHRVQTIGRALAALLVNWQGRLRAAKGRRASSQGRPLLPVLIAIKRQSGARLDDAKKENISRCSEMLIDTSQS